MTGYGPVTLMLGVFAKVLVNHARSLCWRRCIVVLILYEVDLHWYDPRIFIKPVSAIDYPYPFWLKTRGPR